MEPEPLATPLRDMLPVLVWGAVALGVAFVILALVRLWGWRTQKRGGSCGDIDLASLRGQLVAGQISRQEYEAVCARLAGAAPEKADGRPGGPRAVPDTESSIETHDADHPGTDTGDETSERSRTDGEA